MSVPATSCTNASPPVGQRQQQQDGSRAGEREPEEKFAVHVGLATKGQEIAEHVLEFRALPGTAASLAAALASDAAGEVASYHHETSEVQPRCSLRQKQSLPIVRHEPHRA